MMITNEDYYNSHDEAISSCLWAMRDVLLNMDDDVTETKKYGMPCFCYKNKAFCYLWTDKKSKAPYFLLVEGRSMSHPSLQVGDRKRMKILPVNPEKDLPREVILEVLEEAIALVRKQLTK